jgi:purine-binding chemotaxis protein CheW
MTGILVRIDGQLFALPLAAVDSITTLRGLEVAVGAPPAVLGLLWARGGRIPVVDLRAILRLGDASRRPSDAARVLVAQVYGRKIGLLVEEVDGVAALEGAELEKAPNGRAALPGVLGVRRHRDDLILVLDIEDIVEDAARLPARERGLAVDDCQVEVATDRI